MSDPLNKDGMLNKNNMITDEELASQPANPDSVDQKNRDNNISIQSRNVSQIKNTDGLNNEGKKEKDVELVPAAAQEIKSPAKKVTKNIPKPAHAALDGDGDEQEEKEKNSEGK